MQNLLLRAHLLPINNFWYIEYLILEDFYSTIQETYIQTYRYKVYRIDFICAFIATNVLLIFKYIDYQTLLLIKHLMSNFHSYQSDILTQYLYFYSDVTFFVLDLSVLIWCYFLFLHLQKVLHLTSLHLFVNFSYHNAGKDFNICCFGARLTACVGVDGNLFWNQRRNKMLFFFFIPAYVMTRFCFTT